MKNILVTGASRGMGKAIAKLLVKEGYFVYGIYNTGSEVAQDMKKEMDHIEMFQCDFSDRSQTYKLAEDLKDIQFYGLVHSAGVFRDVDFQEFDFASWEKTFEINVHAPLILTQALKDNIEEGGSIVTISSTDAMVGSISGMAYSASKAALINLTQSFANIFSGRKIRANNIAPGWIGDGMQAPTELLDLAESLNPLKRCGSYEEIASVASFLLSEKASYVNGATMVVDGGDQATSYVLQKEAEMLQ